MTNYQPKKGDRVRVVLEGEAEVDRGGATGFRFSDGFFYTSIDMFAPFVVSIEKVEPPVTVFKPGDVVREKVRTEFVWQILNDGYVRVGSRPEGGAFDPQKSSMEFTSEDYELVQIP